MKTSFGAKLAILLVTLLAPIAIPFAAYASELPEQENSILELDNPYRPGEHSKINVQTVYVKRSELKAKISSLLNETETETVISSDEKEVLESASRYPDRVDLLPIGDLAKEEVGRVNKLLRTMQINVGTALKNDLMGVMIVSYATQGDVIRWIHADNFSTFTKSAAVMTTIMTAALLSVNKDAWVKSVRPIENRWRKLLNVPDDGNNSRFKETAVSFLSNVSLTTALNLIWIPIVSIDKIANHTFELSHAAMPLAMGFATTAAAFSWYEFFQDINEKENPRAKAAARLLLNGRSITMATFATSAMLLNTSQYGVSPWIAVTAAGAVGLPLWFNAKKIADKIENNRFVKATAEWFDKNKTWKKTLSTYEKFINRTFRLENRDEAAAPKSCQAIFHAVGA